VAGKIRSGCSDGRVSESTVLEQFEPTVDLGIPVRQQYPHSLPHSVSHGLASTAGTRDRANGRASRFDNEPAICGIRSQSDDGVSCPKAAVSLASATGTRDQLTGAV
jgi:hypothetical protein